MKGPVPILPVSKPCRNDLELLPRLQLTTNEIMWEPKIILGNEYNDHSHVFESSDDYFISDMIHLQEVVDHHIK